MFLFFVLPFFFQNMDICTASQQERFEYFFLLIYTDCFNQICELKQIRWEDVVCQVTALLNIGQRQCDTNIPIYGIFCMVLFIYSLASHFVSNCLSIQCVCHVSQLCEITYLHYPCSHFN